MGKEHTGIGESSGVGGAGSLDKCRAWDFLSRACLHLPWGGQASFTQEVTSTEMGEGEFVRWSCGKDTPTRGKNNLEAWKHLVCSRQSTWLGMAGERGTYLRGRARDGAGEASAWRLFSLFPGLKPTEILSVCEFQCVLIALRKGHLAENQ